MSSNSTLVSRWMVYKYERVYSLIKIPIVDIDKAIHIFMICFSIPILFKIGDTIIINKVTGIRINKKLHSKEET